MRRRGRAEEVFFYGVMLASLVLVLAALVGIVAVVLVKGAPSLSWEMLTQCPAAGYYFGGGGGIANAIVGSLYLAGAATVLAFLISLALATYLQKEYAGRRLASFLRLVLDLLWGIPSIVYGVFCFIIMVWLGIGTSLLAGIIALTLLEIPILSRAVDEVIRAVPADLKTAAYSLGSNKLETSSRVVWRQAALGILSGVLLAFGRGVGDAASILFTAGFTDYIPASLKDSAAALPTMIFFLSTSPLPVVRQRAYAAAFVLLIFVLIISLTARVLTARFSKYTVK